MVNTGNDSIKVYKVKCTRMLKSGPKVYEYETSYVAKNTPRGRKSQPDTKASQIYRLTKMELDDEQILKLRDFIDNLQI